MVLERRVSWRRDLLAGVLDTKLNYIHLNPVRAGLVEKEEEYLYSSCGEIYGVRKGLLELAV